MAISIPHVLINTLQAALGLLPKVRTGLAVLPLSRSRSSEQGRVDHIVNPQVEFALLGASQGNTQANLCVPLSTTQLTH